MDMTVTWTSEHTLFLGDYEFEMMKDEINYIKRNYTDPFGADIDKMCLAAVREWAKGLDDEDSYTMTYDAKKQIAEELKKRIQEG
jgi:hypothetical protein